MNFTTAEIWMIIGLIGVGTFFIRFSFLGLIGNRKMPDWLLRHLRYTPVAVLPGLVAPMVMWPQATQGAFDLPRVAAALVTVGVGVYSKNALKAMFSGIFTLYIALYLLS